MIQTPDGFKNSEGLSGPFLFILNPRSGTGRFSKSLPGLLRGYPVQFEETAYAGHASKLASKAVEQGCRAVIVAGGDGSVNEVARVLAGSETALGIVPIGSGNGIARHFGISLKPKIAFQQLLNGKTLCIDTGLANDHFFVGFSGVGLDGEIARRFQISKTRGFSNYIKVTVDAFFQYKPRLFKIKSTECELEVNAYAIVVANTSQFGNNAYIHPDADPRDGLFQVCILKAFPKHLFPTVASQLFLKTAHFSKYIEYHTLSSFTLFCSHAELHVDGEPSGIHSEVGYSLNPKSLNILVP